MSKKHTKPLTMYLVSSIPIPLMKACLDTQTIPHLSHGSKLLTRRADVLLRFLHLLGRTFQTLKEYGMEYPYKCQI